MATPGLRQSVFTQTGAVATGTTQIPADDTIPQNGEGTEFMTLAITPKNTANRLLIMVNINYASSASLVVTTALFQDTTAGALKAAASHHADANRIKTVSFLHEMAAGTTSSTTFKVRIGGTGASTISLNGESGARILGGVLFSSITILEVT